MNRPAGILAVLALFAFAAGAGAQSNEFQLINQAAEALGGKAKVQAVKTLRIVGYGQLSAQDGGGNIDSSPDAPQKLINVNAHQRVIDLAIVAVDDHLELKDSSMQVDIYRIINNSHMAHSLLAYVARDKVVAQGDLIDEGWDINWWGNSYPDTVKFWKLDVARDLPVHGNMHTYAEALEQIRTFTSNAQKLCAQVETAKLNLQGCPVTNTP